MAAGDVTIQGPYLYSDKATAETELEALSNAAGDKITAFGNAKQFWTMHVQAD